MSQRMPHNPGSGVTDPQPAPTSDLAAGQELAWVHAAQAGNRAAFGQLAQLYQRQCAAVALRLLGNSHDAAELVQDALVKAYRSLGQLKESERFGPWLMRIVTNLALNLRRSRVRRQALSLEQVTGAGEDLRSTLSGGINDAPDRPLGSAELGAAIADAIAALDRKSAV